MDDEDVVRQSLGMMLETLGYSVLSAMNGAEAVELFFDETYAKRAIAGLVLDLTVPGGMGGKVAAAAIRELNAEIPIFVTSGYADDPVMKDPAGYGFTASICKPFRIVELAAMLERWLGTR
jgi:two-component system cell cycle sensor histidine kinase/response regulator CckA